MAYLKQLTVHYVKADQYLIDKVNQQAQQEDASRSTIVLSILTTYFMRSKRLGEILYVRGRLSYNDLAKALSAQKKNKQPLGEILVSQGVIESEEVQQALQIQGQIS